MRDGEIYAQISQRGLSEGERAEIDRLVADARKRLEGHKSVLDSLTPEQLRSFAEWDEPAQLCGRVEDARRIGGRR